MAWGRYDGIGNEALQALRNDDATLSSVNEPCAPPPAEPYHVWPLDPAVDFDCAE